jgi:1,4-dihydroxy-2-naphthoate octaprenyltransferase
MSSTSQPNKIQVWLVELRLPFLTASIMPILLGSVIAWALNGVFLWDLFLLMLLCGICAQLASHVFNDYFDHRSGADEVNVEFVRPFTGGSRIIQMGLLKPYEVLIGGIICFIFAGIIILYLTIICGWIVFILGVIGLFLAIFYTAPPLKLSYRGIGEIAIGTGFGLLSLLIAYYVQARTLIWEPIFASFVPAILITLVILINEFPDYQGDKDSGKRTLVVRLGKRKAAKLYVILLALAYIFVVIPVILGVMSWYTLIALSTIPLGFLCAKITLINYDDPKKIAPACAITIMNHMIALITIIIAYILHSLLVHYIVIIVVGIVLFGSVMFITWKLIMQGKAVTEVATSG